MVLDAKKAHLHAKAERALYVELPEEAGGGYAKLVRSLYGMRDAPALWEAYAAAQLQALGFKRGLSNACVYYHRQRGLRCLVHGDDFVATGLGQHLEWLYKELEKTILLKRVGVLGLNAARGDVQEIKILNRVLRIDEGGVKYEADPRHSEILTAMLGAGARAVTSPGLRESVAPQAREERVEEPEGDKIFNLDEDGGQLEAGWGPEEEEEQREERQPAGGTGAAGGARSHPGRGRAAAGQEAQEEEESPGEDADTQLGSAETALFRATAARANYLALDRPEVAFAAKELCRRMSAPRRKDKAALRRLCLYLLGVPRVVYHFKPLPAGLPLQVHADTDFAGCIQTRRSTSGGCASRGGHLLKHWSTTQKAITLSSGEAELGGVVKAATEGIGLQSLARDLGIDLTLQLYADSSAAIGICRRTGIGKVRHLAVGQLWVQERLRAGHFSLFKVCGAANPADLLTKHLPGPTISTHLATLQLRPEQGRPASAPEVSTVIDPWL